MWWVQCACAADSIAPQSGVQTAYSTLFALPTVKDYTAAAEGAVKAGARKSTQVLRLLPVCARRRKRGRPRPSRGFLLSLLDLQRCKARLSVSNVGIDTEPRDLPRPGIVAAALHRHRDDRACRGAAAGLRPVLLPPREAGVALSDRRHSVRDCARCCVPEGETRRLCRARGRRHRPRLGHRLDEPARVAHGGGEAP